MAGLKWNTVTPLLRSALELLMSEPLFNSFRLVGGTSLSLQFGHRESIDIDLFTDLPYGSIDFNAIDKYLRQCYAYVSPAVLPGIISMGMSYIVGTAPDKAYKLDLFYTDEFIEPFITIDNVRMATMNEIIAMKLDIVQRKGRKKDFWDLHQFIGKVTVGEMLALHKKRYPYNHNEDLILANLTDFSLADNDFDPVALDGNHWELIKLDFVELLEGYR
jgi:hypothetical protein